MNTNINISLNVPEHYDLEELARQITEYGELLIAQQTKGKRRKRSSKNFLKGLTIPEGISAEQLIEKHLEEKYKV